MVVLLGRLMRGVDRTDRGEGCGELVEQGRCGGVGVTAWCDRVDATGRGIDEGQGGDSGAQGARQDAGYQRDCVTGCDQGQFADQIGCGEVDAGA